MYEEMCIRDSTLPAGMPWTSNILVPPWWSCLLYTSSRTIAGLRSFREKVILIAGGYDKHIPFDVLGPEVTAHVKYLVLTGDTADQIADAVRSCPDYQLSLIHIWGKALRRASARMGQITCSVG